MRKLWLIFAQAVTLVLALFFVINTLKPEWLNQATPPRIEVAPAPSPVQKASGSTWPAQIGFSDAAKHASPAVVSVLTKNNPRNSKQSDPWFRYFFGDQDSTPQSGVGSGVIVTQDGYVLTNNHVIERMEGIEVILTDGRKAEAKVVGTDPDTDLAVLKIELDKLNHIVFGNSDLLQVGDAVLAIGNPFGVGQTVTFGIVSALGRNKLGINTFENFIQTDAAINPGNSGGALVNTQGQLIGINSAIYSRSGGNMGIGFAIPASTASMVMESLIKNGKVTRGWIGVEPRDLTPEIAESFNLAISSGVLITGVLQEGPAANGGMRPGDIVVQIGATAVNNTAQLLNAVAALKPNSTINLTVMRGQEKLILSVLVAQRPQMAMRNQGNQE